MEKSDDEKILDHLRRDAVMAEIIGKFGELEWEVTHQTVHHKNDLFTNLAGEIIGQQLSGRVVEVIWGRVMKLFGEIQGGSIAPPVGGDYGASGESKALVPEMVLEMPEEKLRACGVSYAKIRYVKSLAEAVLQSRIQLENLVNLSDEEVVSELMVVKGIGKWTAEMFLMFTLKRPDVFSLGDLGLKTAVGKLYGVDRSDLKAIEEISLKWKPYRSWASRYLWKSLDNR